MPVRAFRQAASYRGLTGLTGCPEGGPRRQKPTENGQSLASNQWWRWIWIRTCDPLVPNLRPKSVHAVGGDGKPSQPFDATGIDSGEVVESLPPAPPNGRDGIASAEQLAAVLRRTEFLRPEGLLPVAAVAKRLGLSASTVHVAINAGKLRSVLFGSERRGRPEDLEAYIRSRSTSRRPADGDWCTVADVARAAGCSRAHAYRLLERLAVPFAVFAGTRYIGKRDLECVLREVTK